MKTSKKTRKVKVFLDYKSPKGYKSAFLFKGQAATKEEAIKLAKKEFRKTRKAKGYRILDEWVTMGS